MNVEQEKRHLCEQVGWMGWVCKIPRTTEWEQRDVQGKEINVKWLSAWMFQVQAVMPTIYVFFQNVHLAKYQVNHLAGGRRHLSWTLWLLCQVVTPLAFLSLVGAGFFFTQLGEIAWPSPLFHECQYNKGNLWQWELVACKMQGKKVFGVVAQRHCVVPETAVLLCVLTGGRSSAPHSLWSA